jgi:hypothetical protein
MVKISLRLKVRPSAASAEAPLAKTILAASKKFTKIQSQKMKPTCFYSILLIPCP